MSVLSILWTSYVLHRKILFWYFLRWYHHFIGKLRFSSYINVFEFIVFIRNFVIYYIQTILADTKFYCASCQEKFFHLFFQLCPPLIYFTALLLQPSSSWKLAFWKALPLILVVFSCQKLIGIFKITFAKQSAVALPSNSSMPTKTIIKVCGLTRLDEARACSELGVQWLGFNCFRGSKRYLPPEAIATMIQKLPPEVKTVGVFVNSSATEIEVFNFDPWVGAAILHAVDGSMERHESRSEGPVLLSQVGNRRPELFAFRTSARPLRSHPAPQRFLRQQQPCILLTQLRLSIQRCA